MKRALRIVAVLLLVTCLVSTELALTILRPRTEVFPPTFEEGYKSEGIPMRSRLQVIRRWRLYPLREWNFGPPMINCWAPAPTYGWQYGPFAFEEAHARSSWPVVVEKAARTIAMQKLGVKEPKLDIQRDSSKEFRWHVVANSPSGKRLEMNFNQHGKLVLAPK